MNDTHTAIMAVIGTSHNVSRLVGNIYIYIIYILTSYIFCVACFNMVVRASNKEIVNILRCPFCAGHPTRPSNAKPDIVTSSKYVSML